MRSDPKIDDLVYKPFSPTTIGVIRRIAEYKEFGNSEFAVEVEWVDGTREKFARHWYLKSIEDLISDHKKKLSGHEKRRDKAVERFGLERK